MTRQELIHDITARVGIEWKEAEVALDIAIGALLSEPDHKEVAAFRNKFPRMQDPICANFACYIRFRRTQYEAKDEPAVEAVRKILAGTYLEYKDNYGFVGNIVAAVRKADKESQ